MSKPADNAWSQIRQHFDNAKKLLLELSTELAEKDRDWNRARMLFELARDLDKLQIKYGSLSDASTIQEQSDSLAHFPVTAGVNESPVEYDPRHQELSGQPSVEHRRRPRRKRKPSVYFVRNNDLVKQGLRRNGRDIYEHKMSKEEFTQFIGVLSGLAERQETFKPEDAVESLAMSSYKVYLALGAMTHIGELEIPQRGTYRFCDRSRYLEQESEFWNELESQRGDVSNEL